MAILHMTKKTASTLFNEGIPPVRGEIPEVLVVHAGSQPGAPLLVEKGSPVSDLIFRGPMSEGDQKSMIDLWYLLRKAR